MDLAFPSDFAGADDIITNLAKERAPGDIIRTPLCLIITSFVELKHISIRSKKLRKLRVETRERTKIARGK